jgi:sugar (pentulose or hexulose) kinase
VTTARQEAFLGVDVGTQGVRVVAVTAAGDVLSSHHQVFPLHQRGARHEQSPDLWWETLIPLLRATTSDLRAVESPIQPMAISVTSTSGTVIPLAADYTPLHAALMYDDRRAAAQAERCRAAAAIDGRDVPFGTSYGLPKIVWFADTYPRQAARIAAWCHAADFLIGRLSGVWGLTDPTNALKSGYDPAREEWPAFIHDELGVAVDWLPKVIPSGTPVGSLTAEVAAATRLPDSLIVTTGMTDGCASQIAAGAARPGEWSTTIGTTLVVKGVTSRPVDDPGGRLYNHRHPEGWWMPGGASNTGADWVARDYAGEDLAALDAAARSVIPTPWVAYPLTGEGERFPFISPQARGFEPQGLAEPLRYAARLEGVAYLERLACDLLAELSGETIDRISSAGGGSRSETWLTIRANVLNKPVLCMRHPDAAVGAAILAASQTQFDGLSAAAAAMTQLDREILPGPLVDAYQDGYQRFVTALTERGYLSPAVVPR